MKKLLLLFFLSSIFFFIPQKALANTYYPGAFDVTTEVSNGILTVTYDGATFTPPLSGTIHTCALETGTLNPFVYDDNCTSTTAHFDATNLPPGQTFYFGVLVNTCDNNCTLWESHSFTLSPTPTPTPSPTTLTPIADSYLKQGSQNENEGASPFLRLQAAGHNRAVVKFDQAAIQTAVGNSQNFTATLHLTITDNGNNWGSNGRTIGVHRLTKDWTEGNGFIVDNFPANRGTGSGITWNCAVDSNITNYNDNCSGATAWNMDNSSLWPFVSAATADTTITNTQTGIVSFDVTADVQSFLNGTENNGWLLKKLDEWQNGRIEFGSRESASSPQLVITPN
jgi:hypothetical protein